MILPCPLCQARFNVPDDKISGPGTKIQCPKCKFTFVIKTSSGTSPAMEETKSPTDTDPAIDPALASAVVEEAKAHAEKDQAKASEQSAKAQAAPKAPVVSGPRDRSRDTVETPRVSISPDTLETAIDTSDKNSNNKEGVVAQKESKDLDAPVPMATIPTHTKEDSEEPEGQEDKSPTEVDIDPELARRVREEAAAQAPDAVAELELEEVEAEVHPLTPEELAQIPDAEILDADDLAQLAETAGETEVEAKLSPKVEAEAAGQWPSIIVDDPLLENGDKSAQASDDQKVEKDKQAASSRSEDESGKPSQGAVQQGAVTSSRQALDAARQRAQAAQQAVNQIMDSGDLARAQQQLAAAQAELQRAMSQLQAAQKAYLAAQQRMAASASGSQPALSQAQTSQQSVSSGAAHSISRPQPLMDSMDDDLSAVSAPGKSHGFLLYGIGAAVIVVIAMVFIISRRGGSESPKAKSVQASASDRLWDKLTVQNTSIKVMPRAGSPSVVVVDAVLRNDSSDVRYENPYVSGVLFVGGRKIDEAVSPCGARLDSASILRVVNLKGRQGYYNRLRRYLLRTEKTMTVPPHKSLTCQIVFFDSTGSRSGQGLKISLKVDRDKTIAAPTK